MTVHRDDEGKQVRRTKRNRKVEAPLPRAAPSESFLATGPTKNKASRRRIASAGKAVVRSGRWPTLELVLAKDTRIKPATLDRNSDALDEARRAWMSSRGNYLAEAGRFPTLDLLHAMAPRVRRSYLRRFEDALDGPRQRWVDAHGPHPDWTGPGAPPGSTETRAYPDGSIGREGEADGAALVVIGPEDDALKVAQDRIARLLAERKRDKIALKEVRVELAETKEALRRALVTLRRLNAEEISKPSAGRRS
jgi:hypothetical protein